MNPRKLYRRLAGGGATGNLSFEDFRRMAEAFGFELDRVRGSHHIFRHRSAPARLNIQPRRGQVKPYQVKQFVSLVEQYDLKLED